MKSMSTITLQNRMDVPGGNMFEDEIFDYLVMGLNQWLAQDLPYPYPDFFRRACNQLALAMGTSAYPCTMAGLLDWFEHSVRDWYPCKIPEGFDADFGLVDDGHLSEEASQYLYDKMATSEGLHGEVSTLAQQLLQENFQFQKIFRRLREQYQSDPKNSQNVQEDYILLRKFLIEHPFTTTTQLRQTFGIGQTNYFESKEVVTRSPTIGQSSSVPLPVPWSSPES
ncbi:MAG: hypothetical protein F6K09_39650 [Merismopedia sp. SIO2A8]|nr:hypothetical protein [Merismopedia sp. SIO2A8]